MLEQSISFRIPLFLGLLLVYGVRQHYLVYLWALKSRLISTGFDLVLRSDVLRIQLFVFYKLGQARNDSVYTETTSSLSGLSRL